ncbi:hypothetical protein CHS0354_015631 [Potamilus streckersoni]|uniref:Protein FAM122A n=1 Tax=Potamilus streckersoni TaxID=2493646 RepID=A0AAE0W8M4_9BIVA|nr:hypothetical protein CHS0354_015631 [Potamilus streckersoni]
MEVDIDAPSSSTPVHGHGHSHSLNVGGTLKRSNSAPMINVLVASTSSSEISPPLRPLDSQRCRRFSSSSMNVHGLAMTPVKVPDRIYQLKQEESHIADRETAREREVRSAIEITSSVEEFSLVSIVDHEPMSAEQVPRRPRSFSESLHIFTSPVMIAGAQSPTRVGKCFSPSMQIPVKNNSFTPSPSPSPTRKTFVRSISPICSFRPGQHGKRKLESDGDNRFDYMSPPKKFQTGPSTPERLIPHPLAHSVSSNSLEGSSPDQTVPPDGVMQEMRTSSRPMPHMFGFMPLRDSQDMQTTDSETSDIAESTDMSESTESTSGMLHCSGNNSGLLHSSASPSSGAFSHIKPGHL